MGSLAKQAAMVGQLTSGPGWPGCCGLVLSSQPFSSCSSGVTTADVLFSAASTSADGMAGDIGSWCILHSAVRTSPPLFRLWIPRPSTKWAQPTLLQCCIKALTRCYRGKLSEILASNFPRRA